MDPCTGALRGEKSCAVEEGGGGGGGGYTWCVRQQRSMSGGGTRVVLPCRRCRCRNRLYRCAARCRNQPSL